MKSSEAIKVQPNPWASGCEACEEVLSKHITLNDGHVPGFQCTDCGAIWDPGHSSHSNGKEILKNSILQSYLTPEEIEEIRAILKDTAQGADPDKVKRIKNIRFKLKKLIR